MEKLRSLLFDTFLLFSFRGFSVVDLHLFFLTALFVSRLHDSYSICYFFDFVEENVVWERGFLL